MTDELGAGTRELGMGCWRGRQHCADVNIERVGECKQAFLVMAGANQKNVSPTGGNQNQDLIMYLR